MTHDKSLLTELTAIKKLLMLQLLLGGVSRSTIGKTLGITSASAVRALVPEISPPKRLRGE